MSLVVERYALGPIQTSRPVVPSRGAAEALVIDPEAKAARTPLLAELRAS